ncbi:aminotransferase [Leisingera sp. ANG-M1]|uniref:aminotransferase n=1 Tax=Leisingera sp. ANG-M1 TaxID=1577895 RepID=UPI00057EE18B|nr:aminotransferase [Leisingera sp. ANG-M1]KIC07346.1 aminotransferase [Leisingera sp. ANG-M1]
MSYPSNAATNSARDVDYHLHPQTNPTAHEDQGPLILSQGEGAYVTDEDGKRYIEAASGLWCASLGFSEERLAEAAAHQMRSLPYYQAFHHKVASPVPELAERLIAMAPVPMSKVMFQCSGSESNDTAVKIIWYYHNAIGKPQKKKIITRLKSYHGTGVIGASLTGLPNFYKGFDLPLPGFLHTDTAPQYTGNHLEGESEEEFSQRQADELEQMILAEGPDTVAAFFAEPLIGAGGVILPPKGYFAAIQKVLRKYDILLVADEVICGFGRTGEMWGSTTFGMEPDIISCAKQLTSGYIPMSATMINEKVYGAIKSQAAGFGMFAHGYTYGAHPVAAAVALETLNIMEERNVLDNVRKVGARFQEGLQALADHSMVAEVRGVGLVAGMDFILNKETGARFQPEHGLPAMLNAKAAENGILLRALRETICLSPPLIITEAECDEIIAKVRATIDAAYAEYQAQGLTG